MTTKVDENEEFYGYYTLLGLVLPSTASWLSKSKGSQANSTSAPSSSPATLDEAAIKKLYRKASLKHHPDRGGDPATFIKLKRAAKVRG